MGDGALETQGGTFPTSLLESKIKLLSEFCFLGRKDQARLTEELGMRLAGIQDSSLAPSDGETTSPFPSKRVTTNSSPARSVPQSAANRTRAPGVTWGVY